MRAMVLDGGYGLDRLKLAEREVPRRAPGRWWCGLAASINYRDLMAVAPPGASGERAPFDPSVRRGRRGLGGGREGVSRVAVGDLVMPSFFPGWVAGDPTREGLASALGGGLDGVARDDIEQGN